MASNSIIDIGLEGGDLASPPSLILRFLGNEKDLAALFSMSRAWADYGDSAWTVLRSIHDDMLPSPTRFFLESFLRASLMRAGGEESARVAFFRDLTRYRGIVRIPGANISVAARPAEDAHSGGRRCYNFQRAWADNDCDTQVVLFGDNDLEFFTALQVISESTQVTAIAMITVIVGPTFGGVDLSSSRLVGRFHIVSHERDNFAIHDGGLVAVHPSALSNSEEIASCVLGKLVLQRRSTVVSYGHTLPQSRTRVVIGIDASLGTLLAGGTPDATEQPLHSWRQTIVRWGKQHVCPNGPYLIFRSFCDSMYPRSFCAPANGGFYILSQDMEAQLNQYVGSALLQLQDEQQQFSSASHSVSFVSLLITACLSMQTVIVPL